MITTDNAFNSKPFQNGKPSSGVVNKSQNSRQKIKRLTKFCLNKPKLMKEFQNSKLFQQSQYQNILKPYSQRYTYNAKTKSFEQQNTKFMHTQQYEVDYSLIQNLNKEKSIQISKITILKKKTQNFIHQKTQKSIQKPSLIDNTFTDEFSRDQKSFLKEKVNFQSRSLKKKQFSEKRLKTYNRNFLQVFPSQNQRQTLKQYINSNPLNFAPIKLNKLKEKFNPMQSSKRVHKPRKTQRAQTQLTKSFHNGKLIKSVRFMNENDLRETQQAKLRQQELFRSLQQQIKRLYDITFQLRNLGYAQEKVNQWVWTYCQNNKKFLQSIIFKAQSYRSSLAQCKMIYKLEDIETAKTNAKKFKRIINNQQIPLQTQDIAQLIAYLEQILISKQYFELKRIQTQIQDTSYAIKNNYLEMKDEKVDDILRMISLFEDKKRLKPIEYYETLNFYEDAKRLEAHFGKVKGLNVASKRKCQNLTDIEVEIIRKRK